METVYNPHEIEPNVQQFWHDNQSFSVSENLGKPKFYCLSMLPYPSGHLHMGHVRNYSIGDVISRYQKMCGKNVLQPIGWDAFGLPAENAAIKHKVPPAKWTIENIAYMKQQLQRLGFAYDWKREVNTCEPAYYRWEQWLFVQLFKKKLAYQKTSVVNWDPVDNTVLANEQVVDGCGWLTGEPDERREIQQWFLRITAYADELLDGLDNLDGWPEQVRTMQRNWIGRSTGVEIRFPLVNSEESISVYTTRADTLFGCTYLAIAADHPLTKAQAETDSDLQKFIDQCKSTKTSEADIAKQEKLGYKTSLTATHPFTGEPIDVWVANFVLLEYGSGAVMSVPAHDERDFQFAQKYSIAILPVIKPSDKSPWDFTKAAFTESGELQDSQQFTGLMSEQARQEIATALTEKALGQEKTQYRLRDWGVSRQRYWGTPIPIIHCDSCGAVPVPEDELPVVLPTDVTITGSGSPLASIDEFVKTTCPSCDAPARRETDTFDTFVESSWYYARYCCNNQDTTMLDDRAKYWTPVDHYIGGVEHAVMHLLYARFFHKVLRDEDLVNSDEPFKKLLTQGMVLNQGIKMSKSKGNTVDPKHLIERYGADTVRLFTIFASPPEQSLEWSDSGVDGAHRFLKRVYTFAIETPIIATMNEQILKGNETNITWQDAPSEIAGARREVHSILQQIRYDFDRTQFNTIVSGAMKLLNILAKLPKSGDLHAEHLLYEGYSILLRVLSPITPHITHQLWQDLGFQPIIIEAAFPKVCKEALQTAQTQFTVQINGKLRGHVPVTHDSDDDTILQVVLQDENIARFIEDKNIKKTIVIAKRKLINLVVSDK